MKIQRITWLLVLLCTLPFISACNNEDDEDIFVGKTWKLINLFASSNKPATTEEEWKTISENENRFYIKFDNASAFSGRTLDKNFSGTWSIDLKKRTISIRFKDTGSPSDALSKRVIKAFQETISYEGDYNYLLLKEEGMAYMQFRRWGN